MSCSMCDPSGSRNPIGMARLHLRDTFPIAVLLLALIGLPGLAGAEWSAIAETKVLYTDNVFELSSSRRLALAEDPSQPAVVSVRKASDVVWEPSLDVRHRSHPTSLGETEFSVKAAGFVFTDNPIFTHGNYRLQVKQALDALAQSTGTFYKVTAPGTITVIPDGPAKRREYAEEMIQTFYVGNADVKETIDMLRRAQNRATERRFAKHGTCEMFMDQVARVIVAH